MLDYIFVAKVLLKHKQHLQRAQESVTHSLTDYDRQIASLTKLVEAGRSDYRERLSDMEFKRAEALTKIADMEATITKISGQLTEDELYGTTTKEI